MRALYNYCMTTDTFTPGDILYTKTSYGYLTYKLLKIETFPDDSAIWHLMPYEPLDREPTAADIPNLQVRALHVPIVEFPDEATVIGHVDLTEDDFEGYEVYLEHMNRG